ncbi:hypothetical protein SALWKB12_0001 [Snodgrassella communis]|nr:hypothetical protein SALWKB12_0001 [Snodgrassella communis]
MWPVIEASAFEHSIVSRKSEWVNQVQTGMGTGTSTGDVAGIGGDLGLVEGDMQRHSGRS